MQMRKLSGVHYRRARVLDTAPTKAMESLESFPREMRGRWAPRRLGFFVPPGYSIP
jgi:hypothetical protein